MCQGAQAVSVREMARSETFTNLSYILKCFQSCGLTRQRVLEQFLWHYNFERPHLSLGGLTPVQRRDAYFTQARVS
jgi:hypothetical protein